MAHAPPQSAVTLSASPALPRVRQRRHAGNAQPITALEWPKPTKLYERTHDSVTLEEIEGPRIELRSCRRNLHGTSVSRSELQSVRS
jgi:hypothetical protein